MLHKAYNLALGTAVRVAQDIARFPTECMLADRKSAYYSTYEAGSMKDAFQYEFKNGFPVVFEESVEGLKGLAHTDSHCGYGFL